jgi:DNA-binding GntR family transcriptional regulator
VRRASFLEPVVRESTPSIIAGKLRSAIAHGELAQGMQLGEADLAKSLGVSRGPLREAMQRLTQEGLLVSIRNRGLFVIELTEADVCDVYTARTAIERAAAAELLRGDFVAAAAQLTSITSRMQRADEKGDSFGIGEADYAFHERLVRLSGSPRLARMHQTLLTETRMCVIALKDKYPESDQRVVEHQNIVAAINAGDAARVDRLLIEHMADAVGRLAPGFAVSEGE